MVIIWVFVVLILTSSYTASPTSMLTVQQLQPAVTDVKELIRRGDYIGYQEGSFVPSELKKMKLDESKLRSYSTPDQYAEALSKGSAHGGVAAIFDEIRYLKLFLSQYCDGYAMVGPIYKDAGFGFVILLAPAFHHSWSKSKIFSRNTISGYCRDCRCSRKDLPWHPTSRDRLCR